MSLQKMIDAQKNANPDISIMDSIYSVTIDSQSLVNQVAVAEVKPYEIKKISYHLIASENSSMNYTLLLDVQGAVELSFDAVLKKSSTVSCSILYTIRGAGSLKINTVFVHQEAESKSVFLAKGIVSDHGISSVVIKTVINQEAIHADALQTIKHCVTSDHAAVVAMPILEAKSDQIACKHGSSIGSFDAQALFFLQSRGCNVDQAQEMLLNAFFK